MMYIINMEIQMREKIVTIKQQQLEVYIIGQQLQIDNGQTELLSIWIGSNIYNLQFLNQYKINKIYY